MGLGSGLTLWGSTVGHPSNSWASFFKMAAAAILYFRISQILLTDGFRRAMMHYPDKFRQNRSIYCRVILIFFILKTAACHLGFLKFSIFIGR